MGKVVYLTAPQPRALEAAHPLKDVEHLLDLCREIELRARWLTRDQGIAIGRRIDPQLIARLESLVGTIRRQS